MNVQNFVYSVNSITCFFPATSCKYIQTGTSGQMKSALPYATNSDCQWVIEGPVGTRIYLQVFVISISNSV